MTASSPKSGFSMAPKFPKALLAAGLAAALVGCGGGSSNTATANFGSRTPPVTPTRLTVASVPGAPFVVDSFTLQPGTSKLLTNGHHQVVCPADGDACMITVDATGNHEKREERDQEEKVAIGHLEKSDGLPRESPSHQEKASSEEVLHGPAGSFGWGNGDFSRRP